MDTPNTCSLFHISSPRGLSWCRDITKLTNKGRVKKSMQFFILFQNSSIHPSSMKKNNFNHLDLRNILSVRPFALLKKNKLLLNEYLGNFGHF